MEDLAFVLGGLAITGGGKLLWDKYQKLSTSTPYDVVIRINSLAALATSGWEIVLGENTKNVNPQVSTSEESRGVVVSVLGSYNRGKSFLLNELCDIKLPSSNLIHTEGISITAGRNQAQHIIFIDTAGTDTAIPKDQLDDKKATEALLREVALHLCSYIIIVVNRLRATDQSYINQVLTHSKNANCTKNIIIIHNLIDVETKKDIDEVIQKEVIHLFEATLDTVKLKIDQESANVNFYRSTHYDMKLRHFIFAKQGSEAARIWNRRSIDGIMSILQTATDARRKLDVVNEMISFVNTKLPQLFIANHEQDNGSSEKNQQKFQVQQHSRKPFIVLSHRKELDDLNQHPDELKLSPKLLYDDAGYFIGISSMNNGQWQPIYNLYETNDKLDVVIELAGFKKGEAKSQVAEESIIIEGCRVDFKEALTLTSPTIHQEKIPIGKFKLEIPLPCKIDPDTTELECDEGLFKFQCPKKKATVKFF
jgi:HSP20 family molecular chaperone IbpA/ABC-type cobalamin/Fe3+-siderophores transport system ATPase subunit